MLLNILPSPILPPLTPECTVCVILIPAQVGEYPRSLETVAKKPHKAVSNPNLLTKTYGGNHFTFEAWLTFL